MKVGSVKSTIVSVPYKHREVSAQVARDGVSDVVVRIESDDGLVGWGEACSGADVASIDATITAMTPFVLGRDPWNRALMRAELYQYGLWQYRPMTGNFAWAGIDMALADLCARSVGQPLYRLFGGLRRREVSYFYYLAQGDPEDLAAQCADGLQAGFDVFYLKVGIDFERELEMIATVRDALGDGPRLRLDANAAWAPAQARTYLRRLEPYTIDFVEQPVREHPIALMTELRAQSGIALAANEGLWTEADVYDRIKARVADVLCFSPYWVGSLAGFHRLSHLAHLEGLTVCKHTHGELGIAAAACHHLLLTLPSVVEGHQQTAYMLTGDVLREPLPLASGSRWGVPAGVGLGIAVDEEALAAAAARYHEDGPYLPYQPGMIGRVPREPR